MVDTGQHPMAVSSPAVDIEARDTDASASNQSPLVSCGLDLNLSRIYFIQQGDRYHKTR